jgi:hypothetical protein
MDPPPELIRQQGGALRQEEEAIEAITQMFREVSQKIWRKISKQSAKPVPEAQTGKESKTESTDTTETDKDALIDQIVRYTMKNETEGRWDGKLKHSLPPLTHQLIIEEVQDVVPNLPDRISQQMKDGACDAPIKSDATNLE